MKNLNLIKRLWTDSHEKQKPQRFVRYAAMLIMLLTLGVGQMWADNAITVYCAISDATKGSYTLKVKANIGDNNTWREYTMSQVDDVTYRRMPLYTATIYEKYGGVDELYFNLYSGDTEQGWSRAYSGWTGSGSFSGKIFIYNASNTGSWDTYKTDHTVYWVNTEDKEGTPKVHLWNGESTEWPGVAMESTGKTYQGHAIYTYTTLAEDGLFNIGGDSYKTADLEFDTNAGRMYLGKNDGWNDYHYDHKVIFHSNGGSGSMSNQTMPYNISTSLTANGFTAPTGHQFAGWATTSGGTAAYEDSESIKLTDSDLDLYAKWLPQSLTITSHPTYLTTTDKLTLGIDYANIPSGYCYRVKVGAGYYNNSSGQDRDAISGTGSTNFTSYSGLPLGANTVVVELWKNSPFEQQSVVSDGVTVTVEQAYLVNVQAKTDGVESTTGGTVSPASVNASAHLGQTITASTPNTGYDFNGWTKNTDNITIADASARTTTVYATAGGWVYANYVRQVGSYSTTFYAGDHGSINAKGTAIAKNGNASVTIGENETLSATPETGYVFDHWGTTGSVSVASETSASTTVTATDAGGTVTAYYKHVPVLGAVTATPSGTQNYAGSPIDFALSVTSTYLPNPVVIFYVTDNSNSTIYEVVATTGAIGSSPNYETTHTATFYASNAATYSVTAEVFAGELIDNFVTNSKTYWYNLNGGSATRIHNDLTKRTASNGSSDYLQITCSTNNWHTAYTCNTADNTEGATSWGKNYNYFYVSMYAPQAESSTKVKYRDHTEAAGSALSANTWQRIKFTRTDGNIDYIMPFVESADNNSIYIDDIILSNEASMTAKATAAATASFSINWDYTVTLNNNGATDAGTESVNVTYGSATGITNITVPTKTGYTFGGYYTEDAGAGTLQINASGVWQNAAYVADGKWNSGSNQTLYAKWTAKTYTVNFDQQDGTGGSSSVTATYGSDMPSATMPTRSGYDFGGYYTEEDGEGTQYYAADGSSARTWNIDVNNTTLYAKWLEKPVVYILQSKHANSSLGEALENQSSVTLWGWTVTGSHNFYDYNWPGPNTSEINSTCTDNIVGDTWYKFEPTNTEQVTASTPYKIIVCNNKDNKTNLFNSDASSRVVDGVVNSGGTFTGAIWVVIYGTSEGAAHVYTSYPDEVATPYNVTYNAGDHGDLDVFGTPVTSGNSQTIATTKNRTLTATPASGYGFERWITTGGASVADAFSASTTVSATSAGGTVTAKWYTKVDSKFYVIGDFAGGAWTDVETHPLDRYYPGESTVYYRTVTVDAVDKYFRFFKKESSNHAYGASSDNLLVTKGIDNKVDANRDYDNNFKYSAGGTVWVVLDATNNKCWIQDPDEKTYYTVTFGKGTGGSDISAEDSESHSLTSGVAYEEGISITFTQTAASGYSFKEWNTKSDGSGETLGTGATYSVASLSADISVYAIYNETLYTCTVSCDANYGSASMSGSVSLGATPRAISVTAKEWCNFDSWVTTGGVSVADAYDPSTTVTASNTGTLTATFNTNNIIYFDRSAVNGVWSGSDVYVTFFTNNEHWEQFDDDCYGKGQRVKMVNYVSTLHNLKMNRIPNTEIYYLYTGGAATQWYMFTDKDMPGVDETTWNQAAVARADFSSSSGCNMFVVENYVDKTVANTGYYYGYWMKYHEEDPGVQLCIYSSGSSDHISGSPFTLTTDEIGSTEFTKSVHLSAATTYAIELHGLNGIYYKNKGTMTSKGSSGWEYVEREATRGHITTTAEGDYKFTLSCANQLILSAEYPLDVNDFQIVFNGKVKTTDGSNKIHPSRVIRHLTEAGSQKDTISFFVIKDNDWSLQIQKCNQVNPEITWENVGSAISPAAFGNPATGVYNFVVEQTHDGSSNSVSINTKIEKYDGHFYIRSDAAKGGWEGYKKALDNQMIYSNFSRLHSDFDYYHCHYSNIGKSVKFTIANDYSSCVSDTTENDAYVTSYGNLPADASVRFMWNSETNVLSRAYLNGSSTTDFLLLEAKGDSLKNIDGTAIAGAGILGSVKFKDMGNWIYQKEVQALPGTRVRLTSNYRFSSSDHIQYFKGESGEWDAAHGANTDEIIGGTTNSWERLRLVYDFKTNHLTSAWLPPTSAIDEEKSINADMLLIRRGQSAAQQLTFGVNGKIANVKTIVGAMEFVKDSIVGRVSHFNGDVIGASGNRANRELMHYISFPFDVAVNDIYGFGQLNKEWYLQYYDGAERASKGFFRGDGTTTFWKYMTLADTLHANVGYSLLLDNDYFNTTGDGTVWNNTISDSIYLYFPSAKELSADSVIKSGTKTIRVPEHKHTSGRTFEITGPRTLCHDFTDSDWNMMGVPLFQNQTGLAAYFDDNADPSDWPGGGKGYFYEWDSISNNFAIHTAEDYIFKSMHGYMVQYSGEVSFTGASIQPASSVVARRAQKSRENYTMELQLLKENKRTSRTYIELREEACDTFALDEDVYMVYTSHPADLYTYAGNYDVSANVLSMDNHSIPVGIEVHQAGEYTFTMPSSFNGAATLIDTQTGARTNLALGDYTVSLPKGVCDGRFFIELDLNKMPTAIDGVTDGSGSLRDGNAHKFIENGIMYILRDGILYDARGNKVK